MHRLELIEAKVCENLSGHGCGLDLQINQLQVALWIDHKGMAHHAHVFTAHEFFESIAFVRAGHWARLAIGEQGERKLMLIDEFRVRLSTVFANSKYLNLLRLEGFPEISEIAGFLCAAWCVVLRIEVDHHALAAKR